MAGNKKILLAEPHGFCAGVARAIDIIEAALKKYGPPIYCLNEIVHNRIVVQDLAVRGVVFVKDIETIPEHATTLFSAHGVSPAVRHRAEQRHLNVIDATCPFVTKVHSEVRRYRDDGYSILLIGYRGHEEIVGVAGEALDRVTVVENDAEARAAEVPDPERVAVLTQTTLSTDEVEHIIAVLKERFPALATPPQSDICYATRNRQQAVRELARHAGLILVLGAKNSSNSNRLVEVARSAGCNAELMSEMGDVEALSLDTIHVLGITAGASTPESFMQDVIKHLEPLGFAAVESLEVVHEEAKFSLPPELRA